MININLQNIPNQSLSIRLDNNLFDLQIKEANGIMACDVVLNGIILQTGERAVSGFPLIPYQYQENGNFVFVTEQEAYPYWDQFGITQSLVYASQAELEALRAAA